MTDKGTENSTIADEHAIDRTADLLIVGGGPGPGEAIKYWVRPDLENRLKEGSIRSRFNARVCAIRPTAVRIETGGSWEDIPADAVFLLTGYHPDVDFLGSAGVIVNLETGAPVHDPETLETNVPGLFLAGSVISGRNTNRVFIENGRFHGGKIVEAICRRLNRGRGPEPRP